MQEVLTKRSFSTSRWLRRGIWIWLVASVGYLLWPLPFDTNVWNGISSTRVLDRNGRLLREIRPEGRGIYVDLDDVSPHAIDALLAAEDRNFYRHFGIDLWALARAGRDNLAAGRVVSGGSTITMQVARILRRSPSRSIFHKLTEMGLALRLEVNLSKKKLLNLWLNRAYFGNQSYGIEAASRLYFGKAAHDLTLSEAAFLIGLPQRPLAYDPYRFPEAASGRHLRVLQAMVDAGSLPAGDADALAAVPVRVRPREDAFKAPHFVEYIRSNHVAELERYTQLTTTLDLNLQTEVEALARSHLQRLGSEHVTNAAALVLDNQSGEVLAYLGSADYFSVRHAGQNNGVTMKRQPGSALKPFTYALALASKSYTPGSLLPDIELHIPEAGGAFSPQNYDKVYHGPVPLRASLANSYNVPAVYLAREIGPAPLLDFLQRMGFTSLDRSAEHYGVGLTLGNGEVQLEELARAYAVIARQGDPLTLRFLLDETSQRSEYTGETAAEPVMAPEIAYLLADMLSDPEARAAAFGRYGPLELPFPCAVKTGTSKDYRDNWAIGFTPRHTVAVWVGNFDGRPMQRVSGVTGAGPLFKSIMMHLGDAGPFLKPAGIESHLICPVSGHLPAAHCPVRRREVFLAGTRPTTKCNVHREVLIDTRTRMLADEDTPAIYQQKQLYTVFPDMYDAWMKDHHYAFPPAVSTVTAVERTPDRGHNPKQNRSPDRGDAPPSAEPVPRITYPVSGMQFHMDPVLRTTYQRVELQGIVPEQYVRMEWWVDQEKLPHRPGNATWTIEPGEHEIELRAQNKRGEWVRSDPVSIRVIK